MPHIDPPAVLAHTVIYEGRVFTVERDQIAFMSGAPAVREVVRHGGGAVAFALFENGDVLLIHQYRHPVGTGLVEAPAGKLDPGEDPLECARRELEEETGWRAERLEPLTVLWTTPGFCSERLHLLLATGLTETAPAREAGEESITVERLPLAEAVERCIRGEIDDGKTVAGILLAALRTGVLRRADPVEEDGGSR